MYLGGFFFIWKTQALTHSIEGEVEELYDLKGSDELVNLALQPVSESIEIDEEATDVRRTDAGFVDHLPLSQHK